MTNTELIAKIKAEIERLYNGEAPKHDQQCNFDDGYFVGIDAIAQFIDSLELEKQNPDELEEEIERYLHSLGVGYGGWVDGMEDEDLRGIARHFAKWGAEHAKK